MWFPGIDNLVKTSVERCLPFQSVGPPSNPTPLYTVEIPKHPWDTVYVDFLGPFPNNFLLLVMIDGRTRYPEVDVVRNTSASSTIRSFEKAFARHGLPNTIISDIGPPFTSHELKSYMQSNKISHRKITPLWPQGNAEAENFMKPLKKCIQTAYVEKKDWQTELQ